MYCKNMFLGPSLFCDIFYSTSCQIMMRIYMLNCGDTLSLLSIANDLLCILSINSDSVLSLIIARD